MPNQLSFRDKVRMLHVVLQYEDGHMLAVQLAKYKFMFDEVDTSGNGTLGAAEVQHFFQKYVLLACSKSAGLG